MVMAAWQRFCGKGYHGIGCHGIGCHGIGNHGIGCHGIGNHGIGCHGIGNHGIGCHGIGYNKILNRPQKNPPTGLVCGNIPVIILYKGINYLYKRREDHAYG